MANSWHHALSSVNKFGGELEDYLEIHKFMDSSKAAYPGVTHRAILHNAFGIFIIERVFGEVITNCKGRKIPVRVIAEQHIVEDCGFIPTVEDWVKDIPKKEWMVRGAKPLSRELESQE